MNVKDFDFNNVIAKHFEQHKSQGKSDSIFDNVLNNRKEDKNNKGT